MDGVVHSGLRNSVRAFSTRAYLSLFFALNFIALGELLIEQAASQYDPFRAPIPRMGSFLVAR